jgi:hypothetical protein
MREHATDLVGVVHQPEYTGENRCLPCTVLNVLIAAVVSVAVAVVSPPVAVVVFAVSLGLIALRGYLVPGTPTITKRYFPDRMLKYFDKETPPRREAPEDGTGDPEVVLTAADAITDCEGGDDLCLTDGFRTAWWERIETLRGTDPDGEDLLDRLGTDPEGVTFRAYKETVTAMRDMRQVGDWNSGAALLADVAAAAELDERLEGWRGIGLEFQLAHLDALRMFLERCPDCNGDLTAKESTIETCCRSTRSLSTECVECGARLFDSKLSEEAKA